MLIPRFSDQVEHDPAWQACDTRKKQAAFKRRWAQTVYAQCQVQNSKTREEVLQAKAGTEGRFISEHKLVDMLGRTAADNYMEACANKPPAEASKWRRYSPMAQCYMYNYSEDVMATEVTKSFSMKRETFEMDNPGLMALTDEEPKVCLAIAFTMQVLEQQRQPERVYIYIYISR